MSSYCANYNDPFIMEYTVKCAKSIPASCFVVSFAGASRVKIDGFI